LVAAAVAVVMDLKLRKAWAEGRMANMADFFVSYTGVDRTSELRVCSGSL
jgi:hypothetical protein